MDRRKELTASLCSVRVEMAQAAEVLTDALRAEREALNAGDTDALDAAGAAKAGGLDALESLDAERRHLLSALGDDQDALSADPEWRALRERLSACREANQVNGAIVAHQLNWVREALAMLNGESPSAMIYGPKGQQVGPALNMTRQQV